MGKTIARNPGRLDAEDAAEFFEHALIGMARFDPSGRFVQVNQSLCTMLGRTREELLQLGFLDVSHPEDVSGTRTFMRETLEGEYRPGHFEKRCLRKDGSLLYALVSATLIRDEEGRPHHVLTQVIDVSEQLRRRRMQDAHAQVLEMVAMDEPLSAVLLEIVKRAEELNPEVRASVQLLSEDGRTLSNGAAPSMPPAYAALIDGLEIGVGIGCCGTSAATGRRVVVEDVRNHPYWAPYQDVVELGEFEACWSEPILDAQGRVLGTFAMYYREPRAPEPADLEFTAATARLAGIVITRRRAEAALSQSEARLRASEENLRITLDSIGDAVVATDAQGLITRMNPVAEGLTGWSSEDALGRPLTEVFRILHADSHETIGDPIERILSKGQVIGLAEDALLVARDGKTRSVADSGAPIRDRDGRVVGAVLVFRDVSEEYELQERRRHTQKMEAIGQLAGGVAHDFNNLLTAILGNAELLTMTLGESTPEARLASQIIQASSRGADLTRQLLAFSRKGALQTVVVDLHALIDEVVLLLSRIIDKRIEISVDLRARSSFILGDPSQLQNVILNLAVNARDAMPQGGTLAIRTRDVHRNAAFCAANGHQLRPGRHVELSLSDTGIGMTPELQERIFEPFFTTKGQGGGTGLGLAGVYGTVQSHGGLIRVESDPDQGATFRILLPLVQPELGSRPVPIAGPVSGQGHVLVVDDEEIVRSVAVKALRRFGYTVTACSDGAEAVELFETRSREFDLVILDMMMPKLNGLDTFRRMKQIRPDLRVLVSSGFSRDRSADTLLEEGALGFLTKPFSLEELSREVARICAGR